MVNRERSSYEGGTHICSRRGAKRRGSMPILQYPSGRTQGKIENNRVGHKKLLVAGGYKGNRKICEQMQCLSTI